jgi:multiple sugar transport system permease protein
VLDLRTLRARLSLGVVVVIVGAFLFLPLVWMLRTAFTPDQDLFGTTFTLWPRALTLSNFTSAIEDSSLARYLLNSLVAAGGAAVISTALSACAAYGLALFRFRFNRTLMYLFLVGQVFPVALVLVSLYPQLQRWHLTDNLFGLMLAYVILSLPAAIYIMHSYFSRIPVEIVEAARVDGAGELRAFLRIVVPISRPALVAVALFAFMWGWNDLLFSLTLTTSEQLRMLGPGLLATYMGQFRDDWGGIMAASLVASLPVVALFIALQRSFIRGLMAGAVKG